MLRSICGKDDLKYGYVGIKTIVAPIYDDVLENIFW